MKISSIIISLFRKELSVYVGGSTPTNTYSVAVGLYTRVVRPVIVIMVVFRIMNIYRTA